MYNFTKAQQRYYEELSNEFDVDLDTVWALADLLGENEDYDGLVCALEDFASWEE